ncbi:MAG: hypothetical protein ACPG6V_03350 [Flavobacteriales bacterium]
MDTIHKIEPNLTLEKFDKYPWNTNVLRRNINEDNEIRTISNLKFENSYYNISFYFENNKLKRFTFRFQSCPFEKLSGWDSWNENAELKKLNIYKLWIKKNNPNNNSFSWGNVRAVYQSKTGQSQIEVEYS